MIGEFVREYRLDTLGDVARGVTIEATAEERQALSRRFGLVGIERLEAEATLTREGAVVFAIGRMRASVVQACVASGEPLHVAIDETFDLRFVPAETLTLEHEVELDENDLDEVPYAGGAIDLGEAVAETLPLVIDPFPRGPNADQALKASGVVGEEETGPFAALKGLLGK